MAKRAKRNDRKPRYGGSSKPSIRRRRSTPRAATGDAGSVRLQKVLAAAGVGSRRHCEEIIAEGRVEVDGQTVTELGTRVSHEQEIRVDGERLRRPKRVYFLINKPVGVISTNYDPTGRARVVDFAPSRERLFTIGRLDKASDGLILATNDGELTDLLTHPRYGVEKTYLAEVAGVPTPESIEKLRKGVRLAEGFAHAKRVHVRRSHKHSTIMEIVLDEGRNREVRRLLARIGHKVMKLRRIAMGPLRLGTLKPGESRPLRSDEVQQLYEAALVGRKKDKAKDKSKPSAASKPTTEPRPTKTRPAPGAGPLIDRSVSVDLEDDDELLLFADAPGPVDDFDDIEPDEPIRPRGSLKEAELGTVDLRPISPVDKRRKAQPPRTVIGEGPSGSPGGRESRGKRRTGERRGGKGAARGKFGRGAKGKRGRK